jgi:hypothetical protein
VPGDLTRRPGSTVSNWRSANRHPLAKRGSWRRAFWPHLLWNNLLFSLIIAGYKTRTLPIAVYSFPP